MPSAKFGAALSGRSGSNNKRERLIGNKLYMICSFTWSRPMRCVGASSSDETKGYLKTNIQFLGKLLPDIHKERHQSNQVIYRHDKNNSNLFISHHAQQTVATLTMSLNATSLDAAGIPYIHQNSAVPSGIKSKCRLLFKKFLLGNRFVINITSLYLPLVVCYSCLLHWSSALVVNYNPANHEATINGVPLRDRLSPFHKLDPDAYYDPPEFIRSRNFIPEVHHIVTKDNYINTMHRIVNPLVPPHLRHKLKPILLQHGLFTSSFNFIISSDRNSDKPRFDARDIERTWPKYVTVPESPFSWQRILETINDLFLARLGLTQSSDRALAPHMSETLAFELANQGYDVWMSNSRGSTYSLNHTQFDYRYDWRYWDFSFHEIGLYDLPAQIDYILQLRGRKSLAYVGHSQGNLAMFILQSFHPEWAQKVRPFIALSPVAFIPDVYFGLVRALVKTIQTTLVSTTQLNRVLKGQLFPNSPLTNTALDFVCVPKVSTPICNIALSIMLGNNLRRHNDSLTPVIAHHIPEGTSVLNVLHFGQMIESGEFRSFNFGPNENYRRYGNPVNPFYPIGNIISPDIAFISGRTDVLSTMKNVELTKRMLRVPLMDDYVVPELAWGHADHMYGVGAGRLVNAHLIGLVDRYRLVE